MSDAVKFLRDWLEKDKQMDVDGARCPFHTITMKERKFFEEACLALEENPKLIREVSEKNTVITIYDDRIQTLTEERDKYKEKLDRLKKWLDKRIEDVKEIISDDYKGKYEAYYFEAKIRKAQLKEVKEVLENE